MDVPALQELLRAIKDAVSGSGRKEDDVALPIFDPTTSDLGAETWCNNIEALAKEFSWSSIATAARAGKALKGSAKLWFETWDPTEGRSWQNLRTELTALYPEKKNLAEKLQKAVLYTSDSADSYCEYAREKIRLLRNTKVAFSELQLVELVCGSISDVNVKMASFNSSVKTTSELISLFTSYVKTKKRPLEQSGRDSKDPSGPKRAKNDSRTNDTTRCFNCNKIGHTRLHCRFNSAEGKAQANNSQSREQKLIEPKKYCSYCKKVGHYDSICWYKPQSANKTVTIENEVNFLEKLTSN